MSRVASDADRARVADVVRDVVLPADRRYLEVLEREVLPASREVPGLISAPNGDVLYRHVTVEDDNDLHMWAVLVLQDRVDRGKKRGRRLLDEDGYDDGDRGHAGGAARQFCIPSRQPRKVRALRGDGGDPGNALPTGEPAYEIAVRLHQARGNARATRPSLRARLR